MTEFSAEGIARLTAMRDNVNEKFLAYASDDSLIANLQPLSQLALIGQRMDSMIRQHWQAVQSSRRRGFPPTKD